MVKIKQKASNKIERQRQATVTRKKQETHDKVTKRMKKVKKANKVVNTLSTIPWIAAIVGSPGSGANEVCKRLSQKFGFVHISPDIAVRRAISENSILLNGVHGLLVM